MNEGILWFDKDPRHKLADKVQAAATRYREKFGQRPTTCYINPADLTNGNGSEPPDQINGIRLRVAPNIQKYHYWIGVEK